jgi:hypothetical protein
MQSGRPFVVRYGEALVFAGGIGMVGSWFTDTKLPVFLAGCVAAAIGCLMLWAARRQARGGEAG